MAYESALATFSNHFVGNIDVPVLHLRQHPKQRKVREDHIQRLQVTMGLYERRKLAPIHVVLPSQNETMSDNAREWVANAEAGNMSTPVPDDIVFEVIDGVHRFHASKAYIEDLESKDEQIDPPAYQWPANVYRNGESSPQRTFREAQPCSRVKYA